METNFLKDWLIHIIANDDTETRERELRDVCEILGVEPSTRYRWISDETLFLFERTFKDCCKALVDMEVQS